MFKLFYLNILIVLLTLSFLNQQLLIFAQNQRPPILIPLSQLIFSPTRENFTEPGISDLEVLVRDFELISTGANCEFIFTQILSDPLQGERTISEFETNVNYIDRQCRGVLPANNQVSSQIQVEINIFNPNGQSFGAFLDYFSAENLQIVDPNEFSLPRELYLPEEVSFIINTQDREIEVGNRIEVQLEIRNRNEFLIENLETKSTVIDQVGVLDCDSFQFTDQRLNGDIIWKSGVQALAQEVDEVANCLEDNFSFETKLSTLGPGKTTRLNFSIDVQKTGELKFDYTTNLDQGGISKVTEAIKIVPSTQNNRSVSPIIYFSVGSTVVLILGYSIYKVYKRFREN